MKRLLILIFFMVNINIILSAYEFGLIGGLDFMSFHPDRVRAQNNAANPAHKVFDNYPFGYGDLFFKNDFSDNFGYNIVISRDKILWNNLYAKLTYNTDLIYAEFGPFTGISDDFNNPTIGFVGFFQISFPRIAFFSVNGSATMNSFIGFMGNDTGYSGNFTAGFWLGKMIPSFSVEIKSFSRNTSNEAGQPAENDDLFIRYQASLEFFRKASPVVFRMDAAYQTLSRTYSLSEKPDEISALLAGIDITWQLSKPIKFFTGFEMPVHSTAKNGLEIPDGYFNMFKITSGFTYRIFPRTSGL